MTHPTWQYRLTSEALIEEIAGRTRFYGRWDWCFGCWERDAAGPWRDLVPDWPILDTRGVWLPPAAIHGPAGCPSDPAWAFEARAAYAAYFSLIPMRVRLRAAPQGRTQWRVLLSVAAATEAFGKLDDVAVPRKALGQSESM